MVTVTVPKDQLDHWEKAADFYAQGLDAWALKSTLLHHFGYRPSSEVRSAELMEKHLYPLIRSEERFYRNGLLALLKLPQTATDAEITAAAGIYSREASK